ALPPTPDATPYRPRRPSRVVRPNTRPPEPAWRLPPERASRCADVLLLRARPGAPAGLTDARAVRRGPRAGGREQRAKQVGSGLRPPSRGGAAQSTAHTVAAARGQPLPAVP